MALSTKDFKNIRQHVFIKAMNDLGCTDRLEKGQTVFSRKDPETGREIAVKFYGGRGHEMEPRAILNLLRTLKIEPEDLHKIIK